MKFKDYFLYGLVIAFVGYILLNQMGCVGKVLTEEKEIILRDTITIVRYDTIIQIKEPTTKAKTVIVEIPTPVEDTARIREMQEEYFNKINETNKLTVAYQNAYAAASLALEADSLMMDSMSNEIDSLLAIIIPQKEYKDTVTTDQYVHWYNIRTEGFLEGYEFGYDFVLPKPPKCKTSFLAFGGRIGSDGGREIILEYGQKNLIIGAGYDPITKEYSAYPKIRFNF